MKERPAHPLPSLIGGEQVYLPPVFIARGITQDGREIEFGCASEERLLDEMIRQEEFNGQINWEEKNDPVKPCE